MLKLEDLRKSHLDKINTTLIPATVYYPLKVKMFKDDLSKISDLKKNKEKNQSEIAKAKTKNDLGKVGALNQDYQQKHAEEITTGNKVESGIADFESERVTDNKYLLLHYIHSELAFHATSLEKLTKLYGEIMCHDPKECLEDFVKKYNLNSLRDLNLSSKYQYTIGDTKRKLAKLENADQVQSNINPSGRSNVYGINPPIVSPNGKSSSAINRLGEDPLDQVINSNTGIKSNLSPNIRPTGFNNNSGAINNNLKQTNVLTSSQLK